jgi:hypothetical protein
MRKAVIFGTLTALFFLFTPATRGQTADEVERLRKENELLKKEIELLKREARVQPDGAGGPNTGVKSSTKASLAGCDYELVKCVRDPKNPKKVTFTISAESDVGGDPIPFTIGGFGGPMLVLTARGGETLKDGRLRDAPSLLYLKRAVPVSFQISYEGVDEDITRLDTVRLSRMNSENQSITFYNIKIGSK